MKKIFHKIKSKIMRILSFILLPLIAAIKYRKDPNYDLKFVDKGFMDRSGMLKVDDKAVISRIIRAYNKSKDAQKNMSSIFQVGNEWLPIYEKYMGSIMQVLQREDSEEVSRIYRNFMREPCSTGLHGYPMDMEKYFFSRKIRNSHKRMVLSDVLHRHGLWKNLLGNEYNVDDLESPCIGNPYGYYIDRKFVSAGADYFHYYATYIGKLLQDEKSRKVVVEIGGGYGGMAYYLLRDNVNMTYVDFDLPENMALTAYYLLNAFPEKKALLYGESELDGKALSVFDMIIMPNFEFGKLPEDSAGLIFNSYSLAEMSPETINHYISGIMKVAKRYFFHVNHTKYSTVVADDFGVDRGKYDLIFKKPALWNAGRNIDMDEYEYLYKKKGHE